MEVNVTKQKNLTKLINYLQKPNIKFNMEEPDKCLGAASFRCQNKAYAGDGVGNLQKFLGITNREAFFLFCANFSPLVYKVSKEETIKYLKSLQK